MDEKKAKLRKMAVWAITVFAAVFAVTFAVLWLMNYPLSTSAMDTIGNIFATGWPILLAAFVLCVLAYGGYWLYLNKKK